MANNIKIGDQVRVVKQRSLTPDHWIKTEYYQESGIVRAIQTGPETAYLVPIETSPDTWYNAWYPEKDIALTEWEERRQFWMERL